jgi:hypothetical protein
MRSDKEHDKCEVEEVVDNEVGTDSGGGVDIVDVVREEGPDIARLSDVEGEPVEGGNDGIQGEWRRVQTILFPDAVTPALNIIVGSIEGIVETGDHDNQPRDYGHDLVCN